MRFHHIFIKKRFCPRLSTGRFSKSLQFGGTTSPSLKPSLQNLTSNVVRIPWTAPRDPSERNPFQKSITCLFFFDFCKISFLHGAIWKMAVFGGRGALPPATQKVRRRKPLPQISKFLKSIQNGPTSCPKSYILKALETCGWIVGSSSAAPGPWLRWGISWAHLGRFFGGAWTVMRGFWPALKPFKWPLGRPVGTRTTPEKRQEIVPKFPINLWRLCGTFLAHSGTVLQGFVCWFF